MTVARGRHLFLLCCVLSVATFLPCAGAEVTFDWAVVGNPGNADDTHGAGYGAVSYEYDISKTEVTNAQYTEFLNAVAASDPYALYSTYMSSTTYGGIVRSGPDGGYTYAVKAPAVGQGPHGTDYTYADKPVIEVSAYDAVRFANWMTNGQGTGDTESGGYTITGGGQDSGTVAIPDAAQRAAWAVSSPQHVLLPTEDEWYKAAYHKNNGVTGDYWDYPTSTNSTPNNKLPSADTGNSANVWDNGHTTGDYSYPMTDVGAYTASESPYDTFDQGGNAWEWHEGMFPAGDGFRGGSWQSAKATLQASMRFVNYAPHSNNFEVGFRLVTIPEPGTLALLAFGLPCLGIRGRRRKR